MVSQLSLTHKVILKCALPKEIFFTEKYTFKIGTS